MLSLIMFQTLSKERIRPLKGDGSSVTVGTYVGNLRRILGNSYRSGIVIPNNQCWWNLVMILRLKRTRILLSIIVNVSQMESLFVTNRDR